jgi:hypothetical protein
LEGGTPGRLLSPVLPNVVAALSRKVEANRVLSRNLATRDVQVVRADLFPPHDSCQPAMQLEWTDGAGASKAGATRSGPRNSPTGKRWRRRLATHRGLADPARQHEAWAPPWGGGSQAAPRVGTLTAATSPDPTAFSRLPDLVDVLLDFVRSSSRDGIRRMVQRTGSLLDSSDERPRFDQGYLDNRATWCSVASRDRVRTRSLGGCRRAAQRGRA